jgi:nucleoside-diphosphate-sugar epimerase
MKIFVTGASGFIGSAVVRELVSAGHEAVGLARNDANEKIIRDAGGSPMRGSLEDLESLARGAKESDGVVHTAFVHDFPNYAASVQTDIRAIEALGNALAGSGKPLVVSAGVQPLRGGVSTEDLAFDPNFPRKSEAAAWPFIEKNVRVVLVRLPPTVHGTGDRAFVPELIRIAKEKGVSGYVGDGSNRWPAVHRFDAARAFVRAVERAPSGTRVHAMAEEGVPTRDIATVIGKKLGVRVESRPADHFGWLGTFFALDAPSSSAKTRALLEWEPREAALLVDLEENY